MQKNISKEGSTMKIAENSLSPATSSDTMRNNAVKGNRAELSNSNNAVKSGNRKFPQNLKMNQQ
jgi:hypothetical protein